MPEYTAQITQNYLMYFILPYWFLVGFGDYVCHRATRIEATSGLKESLIHSLMFIEITIPVMLGLYLEITSLVIVITLVAFFAHEATAMWDIAYAIPRREVSFLEQHLHSYLAVIPFMVTSFILVLHWNDFISLFGFGSGTPDFGLRWKQPPLPVAYHIAATIAALVFLVIPYGEELWRCYRYQSVHGLPPKADAVLTQ